MMHADVKFPCPHCKNYVEQTIDVPSPNFMAEKMKDSASEFYDELCCEHCENSINYWGSNSFYELYLASDDIAEEDFYYGQPEYEFDEFELDEPTETQGIPAVLEKRQIKSLFHFTKVENLEGICSQGIVPRSQLKEGEFKYSDLYRADGFLNANCVSVSFPQYKMFFRKRIDNRAQKWVVFELSPEFLLNKTQAFFERNAASRQVQEVIVENRKSVTAFEKMFDEIDGFPSREETKIPACYPTDPQAEILVFDRIEPSYLVAAHFESQEILELYQSYLNGVKACVTPELFDKRMDHWYLP
ncbi:DarT ssDNA thymidine ADP-ribosyltransferase family protein [Vibrio vulnificus]|uniref:DarT ssDNA thymidine ADP-ribosyltransferase family protein n=1 Tax=Vibrio vulnificus TaxID=672 RepID=UPI0032420EAB